MGSSGNLAMRTLPSLAYVEYNSNGFIRRPYGQAEAVDKRGQEIAMVREDRVRWVASVAMLSLVALLAACGQTSAPATNGATAGLQASQTASATNGTPTATAIPLPYTFPKQWLPAPDGADLPASIGSFIFSPSSPQTGYLCGVTADAPDDSAATHPVVSATADGGHTWNSVSGGGAHFKSLCQLFIDQNNPKDIFAYAGNLQKQGSLYRSQDGGVTWRTISQPTFTGMNTSVIQIAVVQSRLIAMIAMNGEGVPPHSFFASDDGGQSWAPISVIVNGKSADVSEQLWFDGPALVIEAAPSCAQGCGYALPLANWRATSQRLSEPLSSQPSMPNYYYQSTDGGRTWTPFATPVSNLNNLTFTRSADGSTTYALGTASGVPNQPATTSVAFYSTDGGAHWRQLPTLAGVENGYPDPGSLGASGVFVFSDGSVVTTAYHSSGTNYSNMAGTFLLRPGDATPTWRPLITLLSGSFWQTIPTAAGVRVWAVQTQTGSANTPFVYFDLP
jgi:photosystem II stability/assembly factor-like uncharacterized protein